MTLQLDRMALEDVGAEPQSLAEAILRQIAYQTGKVPVEEIAHALGIMEIRAEPLTNLEASLITTPERDRGSILVNVNAPRQRRKFSIGHELGHYLNPYHTGADSKDRSCSSEDLRSFASAEAKWQQRQEAEANRFAIELLAPRNRCRSLMRGDPCIAHILDVAREFDLSAEASARRYVELHHDSVAIAFSKNGRLLYAMRSEFCPFLSVRKGEQLSLPRAPSDTRQPTPMSYADASPWLDKFRGELMVQTLYQREGYATTLLHLVPEDEDEDDDGVEDTYERFARFGGSE